MDKINYDKIYITTGWILFWCLVALLTTITAISLFVLIRDQWFYNGV